MPIQEEKSAFDDEDDLFDEGKSKRSTGSMSSGDEDEDGGPAEPGVRGSLRDALAVVGHEGHEDGNEQNAENGYFGRESHGPGLSGCLVVWLSGWAVLSGKIRVCIFGFL